MTRVALGLSAAFALGAALAAATHANASLLGWLAALSVFAVTAALALVARDLHAPEDLREPRTAHGPTPPRPLPADASVPRGTFGKMWAAAIGAFAVLAAVPFVALSRRATPPGTAWSRGARLVTAEGRALRPDDLVIGAIETVFPEGHAGAPLSATLLLKLENDVLRAPAERHDWTPQGNVAYSKICTHAGCPVAIYRQTAYQLYCPCHQSVFDVLEAARPVSGPATRALPQLALDVDRDGYLVARGDYAEPVGPDEWDRPV